MDFFMVVPLGSNMLPDREGSLRLSGMRVDSVEEPWGLTGEGGDVGLTLAPLRLRLASGAEAASRSSSTRSVRIWVVASLA